MLNETNRNFVFLTRFDSFIKVIFDLRLVEYLKLNQQELSLNLSKDTFDLIVVKHESI